MYETYKKYNEFMKYIKSYKDFIINEAYSKNTIDKLLVKFKLEKPYLTDTQINYYIDEFDKMKSSPKVVEKDIFKYNFDELEKLIDSFPKKVNKSLTGLKSIDANDVIFDENNLLVLKGDTKEKCIKYGKGYSWCVSRQDTSNMFNTYRYRYDEINFYFIFDEDRTDTDVNRALVLLVDKNTKYYLANASNNGDFAGGKQFNFDQICSFQPKLKKLKNLFKPLPLTVKEKDIYNKIKDILKYENDLLEHFGSYEMVETYISYNHKLSDLQYYNLTDDLKSKYINLGHILSNEQVNTNSEKLMLRYDDMHSLKKWLDSNYSKDEQKKLTKLECIVNKITTLKGIENLTNLTYLDCSGNNLTALKGIENLTNLTYLDCSGNNLIALKGIENLTNLTYLKCTRTELESLKGIENLTNLTRLECDNNKLTSLEGIANLTNLTKLVVSGNEITTLKGVENLNNLTHLECIGNKLTSMGCIENLSNLQTLYCHDNLVVFDVGSKNY